jgi:predicted nucleic acid-binding protein
MIRVVLDTNVVVSAMLRSGVTVALARIRAVALLVHPIAAVTAAF